METVSINILSVPQAGLSLQDEILSGETSAPILTDAGADEQLGGKLQQKEPKLERDTRQQKNKPTSQKKLPAKSFNKNIFVSFIGFAPKLTNHTDYDLITHC